MLNANGQDVVWNMIGSVLGIPGRLQGMVINAVINTIDRAQTDQAVREAKQILAERARKDSESK